MSILSHSGVLLEVIADVAGHRDSTTTARVYRHNLSPVIMTAKGPMETIFGDTTATTENKTG